MKNSFKKPNRLLLQEAFFCMIFAFVILGVVTLISLKLSFFTPLNNAFSDFSYLDLYYAEKLDANEGVSNPNIILVNIDRLNRAQIADVLNTVEAQAPRVIGLDVIFRAEKNPVFDSLLAESHRMANLVTTYAISDEGIVASIKKISGPNTNKGYGNFSFDSETSVIRNFQGFRRINDDDQLSFGAAVAKQFLKTDWNNDLETYLQEERPINYKGNRENFLVLEYGDIVNQDALTIVRDKIVLVGYLGNAQTHRYDIEDKHFTPMNDKFVGKGAPDTFGLVIHANIINMIITDNFIKVVPKWVLIFMTILFTYLALLYFIWLGKRQLASYILRLNIVRLTFITAFVWIALLLFRNGILFKTTGIIAVSVFSVSLIGYYKKLAHFLYKKFKWNGYFYQDY